MAALFRAHPEFLFQWLAALKVNLIRGTDPEITIQEFFRSENDEQGFYDIFIRVRNGGGDHLIVVESKIDSTAMPGQLEKYQEDLVQRLKQNPPDGLEATLIYVTRDFENLKLPSSVESSPAKKVHFVPTRWELFLQTLDEFCKTDPSWLAAQVKAFMKEHRIAIPVQVTPVLLDAFLNFRTCLEMFDAVLDSEVVDGFTELGGDLMVNKSQRIDSLKQGWIYGLRCQHCEWQVGFHLGFWHGYPVPGVVYAGGYICLNLKDPKAQTEALASAAKELATSDTWKRYPNEHAAHPGFVWANPIPQQNNAAILRCILQPVLKSMQDFQKSFDFPRKVQAFEQDILPAKIF